jgi:hypothetical protein
LLRLNPRQEKWQENWTVVNRGRCAESAVGSLEHSVERGNTYRVMVTAEGREAEIHREFTI